MMERERWDDVETRYFKRVLFGWFNYHAAPELHDEDIDALVERAIVAMKAIAADSRNATPPPAQAGDVLKPCPFCGGEAMASTWDYLSVQCPSCDIVMERFNAEETIRAWNRRAVPTMPQADDNFVKLPDNATHEQRRLIASAIHRVLSPTQIEGKWLVPATGDNVTVHNALVAAVRALWDTNYLDDMEHGDVLFALMGHYPIDKRATLVQREAGQ